MDPASDREEDLLKPAGKIGIGLYAEVMLRLTDLFKGLQHFLSLTEMSEEKL